MRGRLLARNFLRQFHISWTNIELTAQLMLLQLSPRLSLSVLGLQMGPPCLAYVGPGMDPGLCVPWVSMLLTELHPAFSNCWE